MHGVTMVPNRLGKSNYEVFDPLSWMPDGPMDLDSANGHRSQSMVIVKTLICLLKGQYLLTLLHKCDDFSAQGQHHSATLQTNLSPLTSFLLNKSIAF